MCIRDSFDAVEDACVKSKAWLVMVASDASAKTVQRLDYSVGDPVSYTHLLAALAQIQSKGGEAILPHNEQVPGEVYTEGQTLQVYVVRCV